MFYVARQVWRRDGGQVSVPEETPADALAALRRWEAAGATWRTVSRSEAGVVLSLCTCDGGEEVSRLRSADPDLLAHVDRVETEG